MATSTNVIDKTVEIIRKLPDDKVAEVADFAEYLLQKQTEAELTTGIEHLVSKSPSFDFLESEPDVYTVSDLREKYR
jgi:hypothetical protein